MKRIIEHKLYKFVLKCTDRLLRYAEKTDFPDEIKQLLREYREKFTEIMEEYKKNYG